MMFVLMHKNIILGYYTSQSRAESMRHRYVSMYDDNTYVVKCVNVEQVVK